MTLSRNEFCRRQRYFRSLALDGPDAFALPIKGSRRSTFHWRGRVNLFGREPRVPHAKGIVEPWRRNRVYHA
jgi:hypothetical protein